VPPAADRTAGAHERTTTEHADRHDSAPTGPAFTDNDPTGTVTATDDNPARTAEPLPEGTLSVTPDDRATPGREVTPGRTPARATPPDTTTTAPGTAVDHPDHDNHHDADTPDHHLE
jgi:hypothetical protein